MAIGSGFEVMDFVGFHFPAFTEDMKVLLVVMARKVGWCPDSRVRWEGAWDVKKKLKGERGASKANASLRTKESDGHVRKFRGNGPGL
ncbi:hypothetical protein SCA6_012280 [Theobroma cacao]